MENMTYEQLDIASEVALGEMKAYMLNIDNGIYETNTECDDAYRMIMMYNDEFHQYQKRISEMNKLKRNREYLNPKVKEPIDNRKKDNGLYLVTLSPPPESQTNDFIQAVHEFVKLKVVKEATYVFEQRGITEGDYNGIHTHILCERNSKPSAFNKELERKLKKFFRLENISKKVWNVENVEIKEKPKVLRYIRGEKNGRKNDKLKKVANDKLFRRDWGLQDEYYVSHA